MSKVKNNGLTYFALSMVLLFAINPNTSSCVSQAGNSIDTSYTTQPAHSLHLIDSLTKIELGRINQQQEYTFIIITNNPSLYSFIPTQNVLFANHEVEILFASSHPGAITLYRRIPHIAHNWREVITLSTESPTLHPIHQLSLTIDPDASATLIVKPSKDGILHKPIILDLSKLI